MKQTQRSRLKQFFMFHRNKWIKVNDIANLSPRILQYNRVIGELRKIEGMTIEQEDHWVEGVNHSVYKYISHEPGQLLFKEDKVNLQTSQARLF